MSNKAKAVVTGLVVILTFVALAVLIKYDKPNRVEESIYNQCVQHKNSDVIGNMTLEEYCKLESETVLRMYFEGEGK